MLPEKIPAEYFEYFYFRGLRFYVMTTKVIKYHLVTDETSKLKHKFLTIDLAKEYLYT